MLLPRPGSGVTVDVALGRVVGKAYQRENDGARTLGLSVGDKVRREKALDFSGCNSRPGTGSLHPVAIETAAEATKLSELSMKRVV